MGYSHYSNDCSEYWPTTVICGSMRFFPQMLAVSAELTLAGRIVLMPFCVVAPENQGGEAKERLDYLHKKKIDLSEHVVVVSDESGYIGESTRSEIEYAEARRKQIEYRRVADS